MHLQYFSFFIGIVDWIYKYVYAEGGGHSKSDIVFLYRRQCWFFGKLY